jgi:GDP-L-fucose synthase
MNKDSKIYIAGASGLVGSAIVRELKSQGYTRLITPTSKDYNLANETHVASMMTSYEPDYVFLAAAKVGGIAANDNFSADFITENLQIHTNIIKWAHIAKVKKLLFLGSSCIYPKLCDQPIKEEYLMSGHLEPTNEGYAVSKIAGLSMCKMYRKQHGDDYISAMPTNLYGPGDNYDLESSHVLPAMIRKFHEAKLNNKPFMELWGTGSPMREFLYVDDLAKALVFLMNNYSESEHINIGTGQDISIKDLAELIKHIVGYTGEIHWNSKYPDGTPKKLLNVDKINKAGWHATTSLEDGIKLAYNEFLNT